MNMEKVSSRTSSIEGSNPYTFIDLFAGCGGLSLGLMEGGWAGLLAIEKNPDAFKTLSYNLIDKKNKSHGKSHLRWPDWLEKKPLEIRQFIKDYHWQLDSLSGKVCLVAGGPPCQGFSLAGKRTGKDWRNNLFKLQLEIVDIVKPKLVLMENVQGINAVFGGKEVENKRSRGRPRKSYSTKIKDALSNHGYLVQQKLIKASDFGVPQLRLRYFTVGIREDLFPEKQVPDFFQILSRIRRNFLKSKRLPLKRSVTVAEAISDLRAEHAKITNCSDPESPPGFKEIVYKRPITQYQKLMHKGLNGHPPNSLRLVNHRPDTVSRFKTILRTCQKGVSVPDSERGRLGIRKQLIVPLSPDLPSRTLTTLPDDLLHYAEPRVHTVRESARLQSFPDWFEFHGKFTTGGRRRARDCPRYTQVGNAVPPLLAEAIGIAIKELLTGKE